MYIFIMFMFSFILFCKFLLSINTKLSSGIKSLDSVSLLLLTFSSSSVLCNANITGFICLACCFYTAVNQWAHINHFILITCPCISSLSHQLNEAYHGNHTAGADAVVDANHALVVGVFPPAEEVLVAQVLRSLVHHEAAALHPDRVAAVEVGVQVGTVAHALMVPTLEISVLVENDLESQNTLINYTHYGKNLLKVYMFISIFPVTTHYELTFPIVIIVGGRPTLHRCSLCRCPFI